MKCHSNLLPVARYAKVKADYDTNIASLHKACHMCFVVRNVDLPLFLEAVTCIKGIEFFKAIFTIC